MQAQLVWSARPKKQAHEPSPITKLFNAIMKEKFTHKSGRVVFNNGKYIYHPSKEYQSYVLRFRGVKK